MKNQTNNRGIRVCPFRFCDLRAFVLCSCIVRDTFQGHAGCLFRSRLCGFCHLSHAPHAPPKDRCGDAALELLERQRTRGVSFNLWFKDATGYRGGVLCSCCSCCCAGAEADRIMSGIRGLQRRCLVAPSGYSPRRDDSACEFCGTCISVCPYGALAIDQENDGGKVALDYDRCRGCGACEAVCPSGVISMVRDKNKGDVLDIDRLKDTSG